ncbi:lipoprotein [Longimycelium tulufanense]|uniref:Lipoprotein n=1 Tax=Longimycelium tulufanense TaxID=907463 RepID=A0A8J3C9S4_9PSEU|nr:polysaccharide deacetylase family protein [Longimycelium tulufanense]GGM61602.1 lipoprotein [Longimycelium tulufanense]
MARTARTLRRRVLLALALGSVVAGCAGRATAPVGATNSATDDGPGPYRSLRDDLIARYGIDKPRAFGPYAEGVLSRLETGENVVALTFDASGADGGGVDQKLLEVLRRHQVPATVFLDAKWINKHQDVVAEMTKSPYFEIGNRGRTNRPLSVNGQGANGLPGTRSVAEVIDEVAGTHEKINTVVGKKPEFFRCATGHYDDVAAKIVADLGERPVSFGMDLDQGGTASASAIERTLRGAQPGTIVLARLDKPGGGTAEGIAAALARRLPFRLVRLSEVA